MADGDHARLAPSAAARWVACPGSVVLAERFPQEEEGAAAAEGTAAHWLAVEMLTGGEAVQAGTTYRGVPITDEMREHVGTYVAEVERLSALFGDKGVVKVEFQVDVPSVHRDCWGTLDWVLHSFKDKKLHIRDLKYGYRPVEVFENWQLLCYAAGILDHLGEQAPPDTEVVLGIIQPRAFHRGGPIREWSLPAREVGEYVRRLNAAAHEALGNNPSTCVGPQCKYCPARVGCSALQAAALDAVDQSAGAVLLDVTPQGVGMELALLKRAEAALAARIAGLESSAMASIRSGVVVPGWTVESTIGREEWTAPAAEVITLGDMMGVKLAKPPEPITPAQARKAGLDATVTAQYSRRKTGESKLVPVNTTDARRAFGSNN